MKVIALNWSRKRRRRRRSDCVAVTSIPMAELAAL